jgi:hypothetical protein
LDVYDPFGLGPNSEIASSSAEEVIGSEEDTLIDTAKKFRQISEEPVSGFSVVETATSSQIKVHYIWRANGNIYEAYTDSPELRRLSITTVPKVYESFWLPDGERLLIRYLRDEKETVETFSVKINPATTTLNEFEGGIAGNHLPGNVGALAINPLGSKIFYLTDDLNGASGFIAKPNGLEKKLVFQSPLIEWLVTWPKEEIIAMNTKPAGQTPGYLYFLDSQTGTFSRILGGIAGLTTKTKLGATEILYSDSGSGLPKLYLFDVKAGTSRPLPWNTLPEKCIWSRFDSKIIYCAVPKDFPTGDYPDVWYQGLASFSDNLWSINTETNAATLLWEPEKSLGQPLDLTDLQVDKKDNYLFFVNKTDLTFWSLALK